MTLCVEVHPQMGTPGTVRDIAGVLTRVTWSESVNAPWGQATLTVAPSLRGVLRPSMHGLPDPGDWIVIRLDTGAPAEWWGRVVAPSGGHEIGDNAAIVASDGTITCESWFATLRREQILGFTNQLPAATILGPREWTQILDACVAGFAAGIGASLAVMLRALGQVLMPTTMGGVLGVGAGDRLLGAAGLRGGTSLFTSLSSGGTLGESVTVVYDEETRDMACGVGTGARRRTRTLAGKSTGRGSPQRAVEQIPAATLPAIQTLIGRPGGSVLDFITGTYSADPMLTEMFPSLEDFGVTSSSAAEVNATARATGEVDDAGQPVVAFTQTVTAAGPLGIPARVLGRNPVLIYRMCPWRAQDNTAFAAQIGYAMPLDPTLFAGTTWDIGRAVTIGADDVEAVSVRRTWDDAVTAVTIGLPNAPDSPARFFREAGLPVMNQATVAARGLRLHSLVWPFYRSGLVSDSVTSAIRSASGRVTRAALLAAEEANRAAAGVLESYMRSLAVLGFQFLAGADKFLSGSAQLGVLRPDVRPGEPVVIGTAAGDIRAYCTGVEHTVVADASGTIQRMTAVDFTRGLTDADDGIRALGGGAAALLASGPAGFGTGAAMVGSLP